jgi:hypothetical protein
MSTIMTRSQYAKKSFIDSKEKEMKRLLESINCNVSAYGKGLLIISFKYVDGLNEVKEMITFKLIDGKFKVQYSNFFPYGYPTYFKQIHEKNTELFNAIEAYLRSKRENFVSYTIQEYDRISRNKNQKQVSKVM